MSELKPCPFIDFGEEKTKTKEPFKFEYTMPSLDWYDIIKVEIKSDDYVYFKLSRRYGPSWWLIGTNPPADSAKDYRWTEKEIGKISDRDLVRFIEWAKNDYGGNRIVEISAISGSFDILKEIEKLVRRVGCEAAAEYAKGNRPKDGTWPGEEEENG